MDGWMDVVRGRFKPTKQDEDPAYEGFTAACAHLERAIIYLGKI